jgi:hypothetical protein
MASYNLSCIPKINNILSNSEDRITLAKSLNLKYKLWKYSGENYHILKYDKEWMANDTQSTIGLLRSLIFKDDGTIVCFSPPKSLFTDKLSISEEDGYYCQSFKEGTMINVFYDNNINTWQIATRSSVGGNLCFYMENGYKSEHTFKSMFEDCCSQLDIDINKLNKKYVYSFVMQHPLNRIVMPIRTPKLYLVEIFEIQGMTINILNINWENGELGLHGGISILKNVSLINDDELKQCKESQASMNTDYAIMGVVIKNKHGQRYKFRNPNYEHVRQLRGNQPKLQYQYMALRQENKIAEYLKYYPEQKKAFSQFRDALHAYTEQLYTNYIKCYVKKEAELKTFPDNFKTHMYILHHEHYLPNLMPNKQHINKGYVIEYFNKIHPAKQMFALNYSKRTHHKKIEQENNSLEEVNLA